MVMRLLKSIKSCKMTGLPLFRVAAERDKGVIRQLPGGETTVEAFYTQQHLPSFKWCEVHTGRSCWGSLCLSESSWAPRAASSCWAAHLAPIQSWSRTRHRMQTPRCLCGLCTGCRQMSSLSGADCSLWPSLGHELQPHTHTRDKNRKWHSTDPAYCSWILKPYHLPCCSSSVFCFFRSSISCWWVWFFRLMYWMYSVALSRICAREACLTFEFCQQTKTRTKTAMLICSEETWGSLKTIIQRPYIVDDDRILYLLCFSTSTARLYSSLSTRARFPIINECFLNMAGLLYHGCAKLP